MKLKSTPSVIPPTSEKVVTHNDEIPNNSKKAIRIAIAKENTPAKTEDLSVA